MAKEVERKIKTEEVKKVVSEGAKSLPKDDIQKNENVDKNAVTNVQSVGVRKFSSTFGELQAIQNTVKSFKPVDMVVPLLSLISLILLTIFVYIPMITSGIENIKASSENKQKTQQLGKLSSDLSKLDSTQIQNDLINARSVIPYSLQVSDFVSFVDKLALSKGLVFKEILAGDIVLRNTTSKKGIDPVLRGVSGPVKYSGSLSQITEFFDDLQKGSPFILSADQIVMEKIPFSSNWEVALNITGFYLDKNSIPKLNIYANFTPYMQYSDVISTFNQKAESLKSQ